MASPGHNELSSIIIWPICCKMCTTQAPYCSPLKVSYGVFSSVCFCCMQCFFCWVLYWTILCILTALYCWTGFIKILCTFLSLYLVHYFEATHICICILHRSSTLKYCRLLNFVFYGDEEMYNQYHVCWWCRVTLSQAINRMLLTCDTGPLCGESTSHRWPVMQSFDICLVVSLNK